MRKYLGLLFILMIGTKLYGKTIIWNKLNIGLDLGIASYTLNDKMLNYYQYKSKAFLPINFHAYYLGEKNIHFFDFNYKSRTLSTSDASNLYKYNNIDLIDGRLNYEYYHEIKTFKNIIGFFIGASCNLYATIINESYESKIWTFVPVNNQYSFDISDNLSINALLRLHRQRQCLMIKTGYAVINYGKRPDDFYIIYGGHIGNYDRRWYSVEDYQNIMVSMIYHYDISNRFSLRLEYLSEYRTYSSDRGLKFLKQSLSGGISVKL